MTDADASGSQQHGVASRLLTFFVFLPLVTAPFLGVLTPKAIAYVTPVCGFLGAVFLWLAYGKKPIFPKYVWFFTLIMLALVGLSGLWAVYPDEAFKRAIKLFLLIPLSLVFVGVLLAARPSINISRLMQFTLIACSLSAVFLTIDIMAEGFLYRLIRGELDSMLYSTAVYNKGSIVIMVMSLCAFMLHPSGPSFKNLVWFVPIVAMLFVIQSQATQIGLMLAVFIYAVFPHKYRWAWIVAFVFVAAGMIVKPFIAPELYNSLAQDVQQLPMMQQAYAAHRLEIWDYVSRQVWKSPFIGHGLEFTREFDSFDSRKVFLPEVNPMHPHSFILQIWIELGALGIAIAFLGIGALMRAIYKITDMHIRKSAFAALTVLVFIASVAFGMWQSWWVVFVITVAAMFAVSLNDQKKYTAQQR